MKSDIRFENELMRIVNGALRLDIDKVRNYTAFLADKMENAGEAGSALRLRKMLSETDNQLRPTEARFTKILPVDSESRFPLVEHIKVRELQEPPIQMNQDQWDVVQEFTSVAKSYGSMENSDFFGSLSLLVYGPPGTGKSRLARHIAKELGLELYVARLDGLISSYLGSTSKNIRALFDFASRTPCVLFLDEFDAIAKIRGDNQELGELKRVVNSFLQNLDSLGRQSIIVAATNHDSLLDAAVWRRFTYKVPLNLPVTEQRKQMWIDFLSPISFEKRSIEILTDLSEGFSGSDIREICVRAKRRQITFGKTVVLKDIFPILLNFAIGGNVEQKFTAKLSNQSREVIVRLLRERNNRLYSLAIIAELIGENKAAVHRISKMGIAQID